MKSAIIVPVQNGGRNAVTEASLCEVNDAKGNRRNALQLHMDGMEIFSFAISIEPKSLSRLLEFAGLHVEDVDLYFIHQANKFILQTIAKKLKIPSEKMPMNIDLYGNTSSASVPLLCCTEFGGSVITKRCIMSGFGAGLSWGSCLLNLKNTKISRLVEI